MTGKATVFLDLLAEAFENGENAVVVTTKHSASSLTSSLNSSEQKRLGVIEFGPNSSADSPGTRIVSSPGDLTGLSMSLSDLTGKPTGPYRLGFDDVSPFVMYTDFHRAYRFLNTVTETVRNDDALGVFGVESDAISKKDISALRDLFDVIVEFREQGKESEYRAISRDTTTEWIPVPEADKSPSETEAAVLLDGFEFESLSSFLESLEGETTKIFVYNPEATTESDEVTVLTDYFEELGLEVVVKTSSELPDGLVTLEKGAEVVSAEPLDEVLRSVHAETASAEADYFEPADSDFLRRAESFVHGFDTADKSELIRISRTIEARAWTAGAGELHAGFQRLSLFDDQKNLYERMADGGTEVHVYGGPDAEPDVDGVEIHPSDSDEIAQMWFVVLSGIGTPGTLLARDIGENQYRARWTYSPEYADSIRNYLVSEY